MSYPTAELLGRVERRRRFSVEQKLAILTEATATGANLSEVARRHGLLPAQVYKWRRLAELGVISVPGVSELPSFVAVEIAKDVPPLPAPLPEDKPARIDSAPRRRRRKKAGVIESSSWRSAAGFASTAMSTRRHWNGCSTCWRGDDPGSQRRAGSSSGLKAITAKPRRLSSRYRSNQSMLLRSVIVEDTLAYVSTIGTLPQLALFIAAMRPCRRLNAPRLPRVAPSHTTV